MDKCKSPVYQSRYVGDMEGMYVYMREFAELRADRIHWQVMRQGRVKEGESCGGVDSGAAAPYAEQNVVLC